MNDEILVLDFNMLQIVQKKHHILQEIDSMCQTESKGTNVYLEKSLLEQYNQIHLCPVV